MVKLKGLSELMAAKRSKNPANRVGKKPDMLMILRRAREAAGLTQEQVCRAVGLTQSTYSRFELGQAELEVSELFKLKEFLDKQERKVGYLSDLLSRSPRQTSGKLTEQIAEELEEEYSRREAIEWDRQLDEELPALRKKLEHYERLLDRDSDVFRDYEAKEQLMRAENEKLRTENAELKKQIAAADKELAKLNGAVKKKTKKLN
jgi:transcriptional regulator with XRE-family HTH domain